MIKPTLKFPRKDPTNFFRILNSRVNSYFKDNNIKRTGNWKIWLKTIVMLTLFFVPYIFIFDVKHAWLASDFTDLRYGSRHGRGWYECDARREPRIFFQKIMGQQAYG